MSELALRDIEVDMLIKSGDGNEDFTRLIGAAQREAFGYGRRSVIGERHSTLVYRRGSRSGNEIDAIGVVGRCSFKIMNYEREGYMIFNAHLRLALWVGAEIELGESLGFGDELEGIELIIERRA